MARSADSVVVDDVVGTLRRWRAASAFDVPDLGEAHVHECVTRAEELVHTANRRPLPSATAQFCLLTKRPHGASARAVTAVVARLLAAGVAVGEVRRLGHDEGGTSVVRALYPVAYANYVARPANPAVWRTLAEQFDTSAFEQVFGTPYSQDLVLSGAEAVARFGLAERALTAIWEEGRHPISRETLASRYGTRVAAAVVGDGPDYSWFRGAWPVGIKRIAPGLVAFAMRHEKLGDGRPVIVLNGHVPGLADLFGDGTAVIEAGLPVPAVTVATARRWLVGHDNRPERCEPGTIRRDAADGLFPMDADVPVDSRRNVVHSSDGLLAGVLESRAFLGPRPASGALVDRLLAGGMTREEVETIVLRDPLVGEEPLSARTRTMDVDEAATAILRWFPPVFGAANGFASGLALSTFDREMGLLASLGGDTAAYSRQDEEIRPLTTPPARPAAEHEAAGRRAIAAGKVAFVVPAGGTGGRFGGYDLPESHPSRQKALVKAFQVDGVAMCGLDIRLANACYWRAESDGRLPVAVMASPTNRAAMVDWAADAADLVVYEQFGVYRMDAATLAGRWFDRVLRDGDGRPSMKPPGNLGMLTCLATSGILDTWTNEGVEYLAIANGDDVGFRVDPRIVGMLAESQVSDAVVVGVPWGVSGVVSGRRLRIEDTRYVDETGRTGHAFRSAGQWVVDVGGVHTPVESATPDRGGAICELRTDDGWQVGIVDQVSSAAVASPLFSTNQFYVRVAALREAMGLAGGNVLDAVRTFVDRQPFHAERKQVTTATGPAEAVQLTQGANEVLRHLRLTPVLMPSRHGSPGTRGGYAALKSTEDARFGQLLLDSLNGDELLAANDKAARQHS